MIETQTTFTATSLAGFPARATRAEAEADEARGLEVQAFIDLLPTLTKDQWDAVRGAVWVAAWEAALDAAWDAAWDAARGAVWGAVWGAARGAAWVAVRDAALALIVRDLITADQFAILTAPMRAAGVDFDKLGESE